MEEPIADLVRRARDGSREAFGTLTRLHWSRMVRLARSVVGESESEDAVQDALISAWRSLGGLKDPATFSAWLGRIVVRKCLRKARGRTPDLPLTREVEGAVPGEQGRSYEVVEIFAALAPRQRAVLHLSVVEGMTDTEIAGLLSMRAATVRAHRRRAREKIERLMAGRRDR